MDKRYQVFVSSTYIDLEAERREVMTALLEQDCLPAGMELFPAADEDQWSYIKKVIDDSDYYVVIVGGRYGSTDNSGLSFTEKEYDYAVSKAKPVIAFVHSDPGNLPRNRTETTPQAAERLESFKAKVQLKLCKRWTTAQELGGLVSRSLIQLQKSHPAEGWVRARFASNAEKLIELNSQIRQLQEELQSVRTKAPPGSEHLASGKDRFTIHFSYQTIDGQEKHQQLVLSWDEIVAAVGPMMLVRASQRELVKALIRFAPAAQDRARYQSSKIYEDDFHTIVTQLKALGLIEKYIHKTAARNPDVYWMLTPYGEQCVLTLKAIRKDTRVAA